MPSLPSSCSSSSSHLCTLVPPFTQATAQKRPETTHSVCPGIPLDPPLAIKFLWVWGIFWLRFVVGFFLGCVLLGFYCFVVICLGIVGFFVMFWVVCFL